MPRQRNFKKSPSNKSWAGLQTNDITIAGSTKVLLGSFVLSNAGIDETMLRTVGTLGISPDQSATSEVQIGALGLIVVTDRAAAVGITAIPGPITDIDDDGWFLYIPIVQAFRAGDSTGNTPDWATQYHFDSKAKRIVSDGQQIAMVIENATAFGMKASIVMRTLSMVRGT